MEKFAFAALVSALATAQAFAGQPESLLVYKEDFLRRLVAATPGILASQDAQTGRFGKGIWIVNDQHPIYPLAVVWAVESADNPFYHDPKVLKAIVAGGDALIADADEDGMWEFRKKDGSTWGKIYMPWTYSRWVRAFGLVKDAMAPEDRERWQDALTLGYSNIAAKAMSRVHNIPAHHAMGLYIAGTVLDRPDWREQARNFMAAVADEQSPDGFWSENCGPVVAYGFVYSDALGIYYAVSGDDYVLPALKRAARFHANFTYPDGSKVETIDERNPYHPGVSFGNVGFTLTAEGRGYVARQLALGAEADKGPSVDDVASFLLYGNEGPIEPTAAQESDRTYVTQDKRALLRRKGPWFVCLSAYRCPIPASRWIQDRQNLVSVFHDRRGLIVGGGNTKLQPLWSTFTVGDASLLRHKPGDTSPKFTPDGPMFHVPSAAGIKKSDPPGIGLRYGRERCAVEVEPVDERTLRMYLRATAASGDRVEGRLTLMPRIGEGIRVGEGPERALTPEPFEVSVEQSGAWLSHAGWRIDLPSGARVTWPALPHNPYRKDGSANADEGRIVVSVPFSADRQEYVLTLIVED